MALATEKIQAAQISKNAKNTGNPADSHSYGPVYEALAKMVQLEANVPSGCVSERVDRRQINGRWDDLMLVISKISGND